MTKSGFSIVLERTTFTLNTVQRGDALTLLQSLSDGCTPLVIFDPQHRAIFEHKKYGNEGARQSARVALPQMSEDYIDACCREIVRVLKPGGYHARWIDKFGLCLGHHDRLPHELIKTVDLIAWDNQRMGQGDRARNRGDYLVILQRPRSKKPYFPARATWRDRGITCRWIEKIDLRRYPRKLYPHAKPFELTKRLIGAVTQPDDFIIDPAAGSFVVMHAAHELGRNFIGCDLAEGMKEAQRG